MSDRSNKAFAAVIALAVARFQDDLELRDLAKAAELPTNTLTRQFNRRYGMSPIRWLWQFRTVLAAELIAAHPEKPLVSIFKQCGFHSSAHFSRRFREVFHQSPSAFRKYFRQTPREPNRDGAAKEGPAGALARTVAKLENPSPEAPAIG